MVRNLDLVGRPRGSVGAGASAADAETRSAPGSRAERRDAAGQRDAVDHDARDGTPAGRDSDATGRDAAGGGPDADGRDAAGGGVDDRGWETRDVSAADPRRGRMRPALFRSLVLVLAFGAAVTAGVLAMRARQGPDRPAVPTASLSPDSPPAGRSAAPDAASPAAPSATAGPVASAPDLRGAAAPATPPTPGEPRESARSAPAPGALAPRAAPPPAAQRSVVARAPRVPAGEPRAPAATPSAPPAARPVSEPLYLCVVASAAPGPEDARLRQDARGLGLGEPIELTGQPRQLRVGGPLPLGEALDRAGALRVRGHDVQIVPLAREAGGRMP